MVKKLGKGALIAKADIESAFRILPISPQDYHKLGIQWNNEYYYDKRLPMGASISCSTFEELSKSIQWILQNKFQVENVSHILDNFIFIGPPKSPLCDKYLNNFLQLMAELNIPINQSKTVKPSTCVSVHGLELDTLKMELRLPLEKLEKVKQQLNHLYHRRSVKLQELQSLLGLLNFTCRAVYPGRAFLRRSYTRSITSITPC
jgi:hypothetical protein